MLTTVYVVFGVRGVVSSVVSVSVVSWRVVGTSVTTVVSSTVVVSRTVPSGNIDVRLDNLGNRENDTFGFS